MTLPEYLEYKPPLVTKKFLVLTRGGLYSELFFTVELSHFLGQKNQKNIFFQFYFLLQKLVTFWDKKIKKIFFF